ncbi:hypothetical protein [Rubrivirga sp.]|uniref:hypothetical protein n=1 Tax=Rubrivirga sp. TaxID=1885344 RepID=UPI003C789052
MRLLIALTALLLSGCAATALDVDRAVRERDYRTLVVSGLSPEQAADVLRSDSLAARVPQTDDVVAYRDRWRRAARADSLRALDTTSRTDAEWLTGYHAELELRRLQAERDASRSIRPWDRALFLGIGTAVGIAGSWIFYFVNGGGW